MGIINEMSRRRKISELIDAWIEYRDMVTRHAAQGTATPEQERQFLNLKARISAQLPLMDQITGPGNLHAEATTHMRGMTDLMNTQLSLVGNGSSAASGDDFLGRWHSHFLYLNRFKGQDQRAPMVARRAAATAPVSGRSGPGINRLHHFFNNWFTRLIVQLAVLAGLVILATRVFNIDWAQAPEWGRRTVAEWWGPAPTRTGSEAVNRVKDAAARHDAATTRAVGEAAGTGQPQAAAPKPAARGSIQINGPANRPVHSVDNSGRFIPPIGPNPVRTFADKVAPIIPRPVREFFRPVSQYWGVEMTVALVGIGLLLFAYMIFGRAR